MGAVEKGRAGFIRAGKGGRLMATRRRRGGGHGDGRSARRVLRDDDGRCDGEAARGEATEGLRRRRRARRRVWMTTARTAARFEAMRWTRRRDRRDGRADGGARTDGGGDTTAREAMDGRGQRRGRKCDGDAKGERWRGRDRIGDRRATANWRERRRPAAMAQASVREGEAPRARGGDGRGRRRRWRAAAANGKVSHARR